MAVVLTPRQAPNCNAYAERFVLSIKSECLDQMIFFGEQSLREDQAADGRGVQSCATSGLAAFSSTTTGRLEDEILALETDDRVSGQHAVHIRDRS